MTQPRSHLLDVYDCWLHVATDRKQWSTLRKRHKKLDTLGHVNGMTSIFGDGADCHLVFYIDAKLKPGPLVQIIGHEATHGAGLLLDQIEAEYNGESEPHAWLVGWLTRWLYEAATR